MRYVEKRQITIDDTAVPFNHALLFLGSWLRNEINSRFYIMPSQPLLKSREYCKRRFRGKNRKHYFLGGGVWLRTLKAPAKGTGP